MLEFLKKALQPFTHPQSTLWTSLLLPCTKFDYRKEVGLGLGSNVIMSPVQWVMRNFPEAPPMLQKKVKDEWEKIESHPMLDLLEEPNPFYSGEVLWMATVLSWNMSGNAYWLKVRNEQGAVKQLWWVPDWMIKPLTPKDGVGYIAEYEYTPKGQVIKKDINDVVHFRFGIDPNNIRKGLSPLAAVLREVFTDDEAANFSASMLKNMGIPGVVLSPEAGVTATDDDAKAVKEKYNESFGGDQRGQVIVLKGATKLQQFGFDPSKMTVGKLRNISEERVTAALGIPAAVVGFGTGLQQTKVGATMESLIRLAWQGNIKPSHRLLAGTLRRQLLPDFESNYRNFRPGFDTSEVQALQEDANARFERFNKGWMSGTVSRAEVRRNAGLSVNKVDDVYLEPASGFITPVDSKRSEISTGGKEVKTAAEERAIATAPRKRPTRAQLRLGVRLRVDHERLSRGFGKELKKIFDELGAMAADAAENTLKAGPRGETKDPQDTLDAERILEGMSFAEIEESLRQKYQAQYLRTSTLTVDSINSVMGLDINLPDVRARQILAEGGRRLGLVDLRGQTKRRLFRELTEGRSLGEGVPELVARIRKTVPAGPWSDSKVRARIIARTETKHAQRKSALEAMKEAETVTQAMVLDARLGDTDDECEGLNGRVVSFEDAEQLMDDEHPNGTRDFVPVIGE